MNDIRSYLSTMGAHALLCAIISIPVGIVTWLLLLVMLGGRLSMLPTVYECVAAVAVVYIVVVYVKFVAGVIPDP